MAQDDVATDDYALWEDEYLDKVPSKYRDLALEEPYEKPGWASNSRGG